MSWSDLPKELFYGIMECLEVADVVRSEAVCVGWRSSISICKSDYTISNFPWLMLSSTDNDKINSRYFYSLTEHKIYKFHLPEIAGQQCVGSSQGYILSIDENADLIATNPFAGGARLALPSSSTLPDVASVIRDDSSGRIIKYEINKYFGKDPTRSRIFDLEFIKKHHYRKAILSPDADTAIVIHGADGWLAFARAGDQSWTALETSEIRELDDMIFHQGCLYAINFVGTFAVFNLDQPFDPPFISPEGPLRAFDGGPRRYLVESPCGENLFLVLREYDYSNYVPRTQNFRVYILDKTTYTWKSIKTIGETALFLGFNYSIALCTLGCDLIKSNCIYFTDDFNECDIEGPEGAGDEGVFNLEEKGVEPVYFNDKLNQLNWPSPIWFMPTLQPLSI